MATNPFGTDPNVSTSSRPIAILILTFIFLLCYDGALRKWVFPGLERYLFFLKDFILLVLLTLVLKNRSFDIFGRGSRVFYIIIFSYFAWVTIGLLNDRLPSLALGLVGLRYHLFYSLLALVVLMLRPNPGDLLNQCDRIFPWIVIPICLVALLQALSAIDSPINLAVRGGDAFTADMKYGHTRASATFSYITGFTSFLQISIAIGFCLVVRGGRHWKVNLLALGSLILVLPTNGSRAALIVVGCMLIIIMSLLAFFGVINLKKFLAIIMVGFLLSAMAAFTLPSVWEALYERFIYSYGTPGDTLRPISVIVKAFSFLDDAGLYGFGTGTTYQSANIIVKHTTPFGWLPDHFLKVGFEEESARLMIELGLIGFILNFFLKSSLVFISLNIIGGKTSQDDIILSALLVSVFAYSLYVGTGFYGPPIGAAFFWACVGVTLAMKISQRSEGDIAVGDKSP